MYSFEPSREQLLSMGRILTPPLVKVELRSGPPFGFVGVWKEYLGDAHRTAAIGFGPSETTRRRISRIPAADL